MTILTTLAIQAQEAQTVKPFFSEYTTPFKVTLFNLIHNSHYIPTIEKGIIEQQVNIDTIVNNPTEPIFENTIMAYENSGNRLSKRTKLKEKTLYHFNQLN